MAPNNIIILNSGNCQGNSDNMLQNGLYHAICFEMLQEGSIVDRHFLRPETFYKIPVPDGFTPESVGYGLL